MEQQRELNIFSSVPQEHIKPIPAAKRALILQLLKKNVNKWLKAREIALSCQLPTRGTQIEVRKAIAELTENELQPIISTGRGFCYTDNMRLVNEYCVSLQARIQGIQRRIKALHSIMLNSNYKGCPHIPYCASEDATNDCCKNIELACVMCETFKGFKKGDVNG